MAILSTEIPANRLGRLKFSQRHTHTEGRKLLLLPARLDPESISKFHAQKKKKESLPFQLVQVDGVIDEKLSLGFPLLISAQLHYKCRYDARVHLDCCRVSAIDIISVSLLTQPTSSGYQLEQEQRCGGGRINAGPERRRRRSAAMIFM
jgi:hypothetical protein